METDAILKIVEDAFYHFYFIIGVIVSDEDITIQALLKHKPRSFQGQVLNSSKVKLDE